MKKNICFRPERLRELRKKTNMTQKEFSEIIGCTMASLSAYENGSKVPPTQTLINISSHFDCSIDWLFGLNNEQTYLSSKQQVKTYSEYIQLLFNLYERGIRIEPGVVFSDRGNQTGIIFHDVVIEVFLKSWKKTSLLYADDTIDDTIYNAWKEKVLRDFNYPILTSQSAGDFYSLYSQFNETLGCSEYESTVNALDGSSGFSQSSPTSLD